jgi:hypothetical protein
MLTAYSAGIISGVLFTLALWRVLDVFNSWHWDREFEKTYSQERMNEILKYCAPVLRQPDGTFKEWTSFPYLPDAPRVYSDGTEVPKDLQTTDEAIGFQNTVNFKGSTPNFLPEPLDEEDFNRWLVT